MSKLKENIVNDVISVLLPIHGEAPFLKKVIESIRCQESVEIELVVVLDRPSTLLEAQTELLLATFQKTKLLVSPGSGISEALNFGIEHCLGAYIARIDSDDEMVKDRLIKQKLFLQNNPSISSVGTQIIKISEGNKILGKSHYPNRPFLLGRLIRIRNCVAHPSVMYRREEVLRVGGYRATFDGAEDYDLWIRLSRIGRIANLNEYLTKYRIWSGQNTAKYMSEKNIRAYHVQLFAELEEIAPHYAIELQSKRLNNENLMAAAEEYLRKKAALRWQRLRSLLRLNDTLSRKREILYAKSLPIVLVCLLRLIVLSVSIRFSRERKRNLNDQIL